MRTWTPKQKTDMQQFPHRFCRSNSRSWQKASKQQQNNFSRWRTRSTFKNKQYQERKTQQKTCSVFPKCRSRFGIQAKTRTNCFSKHRFSHKNCRLNWKTHIKLNQWHEFDKVHLQIELLQEQVLFEWGLGIWNNSIKHQVFMFGVGCSSSGDAWKFETYYFTKYH